MTKEQWIAKYEQKAEPFTMTPGYNLWFRADKGFFLWRIKGKVFEVSHACTNDIHYLFKVANTIARQYGCKLRRTRTYKNPAAYIRLTGAHINLDLSEIRPNGMFYWCMEKEVE